MFDFDFFWTSASSGWAFWLIQFSHIISMKWLCRTLIAFCVLLSVLFQQLLNSTDPACCFWSWFCSLLTGRIPLCFSMFALQPLKDLWRSIPDSSATNLSKPSFDSSIEIASKWGNGETRRGHPKDQANSLLSLVQLAMIKLSKRRTFCNTHWMLHSSIMCASFGAGRGGEGLKPSAGQSLLWIGARL